MADLAESSLQPVTPRQWALRVAAVVAVVALVALLVMGIKSLLGAPSAVKRQTARIAILPDTAPPPPPPPKEEKKPEPPKDEPRQTMREQPVKQDVPKPADAPIKMDGPAGDGPSAFAAGTVNSDYSGGAPVVGAVGGSGADRAQERLYSSSVRQLLHDEIEKHLRPETGEVIATFSIWIDPDGSIRRFELQPTGDAARDADLRSAFEQTAQSLRLPGHGDLPLPLRFRLSVRAS